MNRKQFKQNFKYDLIKVLERVTPYKHKKITKYYNTLRTREGLELHHLISRRLSDVFQVFLTCEDHKIYHQQTKEQLNIMSAFYGSLKNLLQLLNHLGLDTEYFACNFLNQDCLLRLLIDPDSLVKELNEVVEQIKTKLEK